MINRRPKKQAESSLKKFTFTIGLRGFPAISKEDEKFTAKNECKYKKTRHQEQEPVEVTDSRINLQRLLALEFRNDM